jgi:DNA-binding MarR family transcriptional regulator
MLMKTTSVGLSSSVSSVLHLLHRAGQCADELFAANMRDSELTPRQYVVLRAVADSEDPSQTTLVEKTGIDRSTLADIVRRLVERGLLQRRRTRRDARMYAVRLTDAGSAVLKSAGPASQATDERLLAAVPARDRDALVNALTHIVTALTPPVDKSAG